MCTICKSAKKDYYIFTSVTKDNEFDYATVMHSCRTCWDKYANVSNEYMAKSDCCQTYWKPTSLKPIRQYYHDIKPMLDNPLLPSVNDLFEYFDGFSNQGNWCPKCVNKYVQRWIISRLNRYDCYYCGTYNIQVSVDWKNYTTTVETVEFHEVGHRMVCKNCATRFKKCPSCNTLLAKDVPTMKDYGCIHCTPINTTKVRSYNYTPDEYFYWADKQDFESNMTKTALYGVELEVTLGDIDQDGETFGRDFIGSVVHHEASVHNQKMYFKHDGTVRPGFEIVTHPMSLNYYRKEKVFTNVIASLRKRVPNVDHYISSHPRCGLHIHLSKSALTMLQTYKIAAFMYSNYHNLRLIGDRDFNEYCQKEVYGGIDPHSGRSLQKGYLAAQVLNNGYRERSFRYFMVNLIPAETIEFRFFKSTLDETKIMAYLELIDSVRIWVKNIPVNEVRWSEYWKFLASKIGRARWPNIYNLIGSFGDSAFRDCDESVMRIKKEGEQMFDVIAELRRLPEDWDNPPEEPDYDDDPIEDEEV